MQTWPRGRGLLNIASSTARVAATYNMLLERTCVSLASALHGAETEPASPLLVNESEGRGCLRNTNRWASPGGPGG